nr:ImmA/IrrE family metallo-endopeptidase [Limosilactobacillus mucosae]
MDEVIDWLLAYCKRHGIIVLTRAEWPSSYVSTALPDQRLILYNPNWQPSSERPFILAHEIGHIIDQDPPAYPCEYVSVGEKCESSGNRTGIELLLQYSQTQDWHFKTPENLMQAFGIPQTFRADAEWVLRHQFQLMK